MKKFLKLFGFRKGSSIPKEYHILQEILKTNEDIDKKCSQIAAETLFLQVRKKLNAFKEKKQLCIVSFIDEYESKKASPESIQKLNTEFLRFTKEVFEFLNNIKDDSIPMFDFKESDYLLAMSYIERFKKKILGCNLTPQQKFFAENLLTEAQSYKEDSSENFLEIAKQLPSNPKDFITRYKEKLEENNRKSSVLSLSSLPPSE